MKSIGIGKVIFITTWFGFGFITMIAMWISDMRNKEFDKNYFNAEGIFLSLLTWAFGYITLVVSIGIYCHNHKPFTKLIYKIANIGVKKSKENVN